MATMEARRTTQANGRGTKGGRPRFDWRQLGRAPVAPRRTACPRCGGEYAALRSDWLRCTGCGWWVRAQDPWLAGAGQGRAPLAPVEPWAPPMPAPAVERADLAERARDAGWPALALADWYRVSAGEEAWRRFLERATAEDVGRARRALERAEPAAEPA
ncbi:MAG: hypothetical protein NZ761_12720 [Dehalococcoidia bacterium]|nr:hypothetical protein [Dehalococcoidia bacterium]